MVSRAFQAELHPDPVRFGRGLCETLAALDVLWWPLALILVPAVFIGAGFPLIASLALRAPDQEGRVTGRIYFANTMGNLGGGIGAGFVLLPRLGTEVTLLLLCSIDIMMAALIPRPDRKRLGKGENGITTEARRARRKTEKEIFLFSAPSAPRW